MRRGEVVLVRFPHPSGLRGKNRPAVIVQSDAYASVASTFVVAEFAKNLTMASDPACLFVDTSTPEGRATGLVRDSVVSPINSWCFAWITRLFDKVSTVDYNKADPRVLVRCPLRSRAIQRS
jgi:mRNA-degrading endonuclease toxin of MazEF toxin-antitoxin module